MISIVIPVYNGASFILNCFRSLLEQSDMRFQAVFVDDGSKDNTLELLKSLLGLGLNIKLVTQSNQGVVQARRSGVKEADGDYILFLDVDDILPSNTVQTYRSYLGKHICDIVVGNMEVRRGNRTIHRSLFSGKKELEATEAIKFFLAHGAWELCGKLFKKEIFEDVIYPKLKIGEDAAIFFQVLCVCKSVLYIEDCVYVYVNNLNSASNVRTKEYAEAGIYSALFIEQELSKKGMANSLSNHIGAMFLLFYSNSLRRGNISVGSNFGKLISSKLTFGSIRMIGFKKAIWVVLNLYSKCAPSRLINFFR